MNIFVGSSLIQPYRSAGRRIVRIAERHGFKVTTPQSHISSRALSPDNVTGVILEMSVPNQETMYMLAMALMQKKPILYLYQPSSSGKDPLKQLDKQQKDRISIKPYHIEALESAVVEFLTGVETAPGREDIPNIKFTLRITKRIERYLHWQTRNAPISKADFLRNTIDEMIDDDDKYQNELRKGNV